MVGLKGHKKRKRFHLRLNSHNFRRMLLIAAGAVAAVLLIVFVIVPRAGQQEAQPPAGVTDPGEADIVAQYEGVDADTLAGLAGDSSAMGSAPSETAEHKIGVTALTVPSQDIALLSSLEKAPVDDLASGAIADFYLYDAQGDQNQQIQDVYAMVNHGVHVMIVMNTDEYNFAKIADIAEKNNIAIVAYNTDAQSGFAVNVIQSGTSAADFARLLRDAGMTSTSVLKGSDEQVAQIQDVLPVDHRYADMWDAIFEVKTAADAGTPLESMIVLDYNGADVLRSWFSKSEVPQAYAAVGTVNFIKVWYQLVNGGYDYVETVETEDGEEEATADPIHVQATPAQFAGFASTTASNAGDVLYEFATRLAQGEQLAEENYNYEMTGGEMITNDTLAAYYEQVKDLEGGLVYSTADTSGIAALFTASSEEETEDPQLKTIKQQATVAITKEG